MFQFLFIGSGVADSQDTQMPAPRPLQNGDLLVCAHPTSLCLLLRDWALTNSWVKPLSILEPLERPDEFLGHVEVRPEQGWTHVASLVGSAEVCRRSDEPCWRACARNALRSSKPNQALPRASSTSSDNFCFAECQEGFQCCSTSPRRLLALEYGAATCGFAARPVSTEHAVFSTLGEALSPVSTRRIP